MSYSVDILRSFRSIETYRNPPQPPRFFCALPSHTPSLPLDATQPSEVTGEIYMPFYAVVIMFKIHQNTSKLYKIVVWLKHKTRFLHLCLNSDQVFVDVLDSWILTWSAALLASAKAAFAVQKLSIDIKICDKTNYIICKTNQTSKNDWFPLSDTLFHRHRRLEAKDRGQSQSMAFHDLILCHLSALFQIRLQCLCSNPAFLGSMQLLRIYENLSNSCVHSQL